MSDSGNGPPQHSVRAVSASRGRNIPLPREHGAWVMLYAPLLTGLIVYRINTTVSLLMVGLATAAFFAQNALGLLLRERGGTTTWRWLGVCSVVIVVCVLVLMELGHWRILPLAIPVLVVLVWQAIQRRWTRRQIDHSLLNEMITVPVLGLGAPAAQIIFSQSFSVNALPLWIAFNLYFLGSVLFVKMLVGATRDASPPPLRSHRGGVNVGYHVTILLALIAGVIMPSGRTILLPAIVGFTPVVLRTLFFWWRMEKRSPALRRVGLIETGIAMWFSLWVGILASRLSETGIG